MIFDHVDQIYYIQNQQIKLRYRNKDIASSNCNFFTLFEKETRVTNIALGMNDKITVIGETAPNTFSKLTYKPDLTPINKTYHIKSDFTESLELLKQDIEINHGLYSVIKKYDLEKTKLPPKVFFKPSTKNIQYNMSSYAHWDGYTIGCYDKYTDKFVCWGFDGLNDCLEIWNYLDNWYLIKKIELTGLLPRCNTICVDYLACSRHNFIIHFNFRNHWSSWDQVMVIDKCTLEMTDEFKGHHPAFYDDYDDWFEKRLKCLKKIKVLGRLAVPLLKMIVRYVC